MRRVSAPITIAVLAVSLLALSHTAAAQSSAKKKSAKAKQEAPVPSDHPPEVHASFDAFCELWMGKLVERERFNKTQIKWHPTAAGVEGEYTGYSTDHTCDLRPPSPSGVPVGRVIYREIIYRKHGASEEAASASDPEIVEVTEITEIFRQDKGKWVY